MAYWMYYCRLGLAQDTCGKAYKPDPEARGFKRFAGCPSCKHRVPANADTKAADAAWREVLKEKRASK